MANYNDFYNVINQAFRSFDYTPSKEEIDSLIPIVNSRTGGAERGRAAVATYVQTVRSQQERRKNDPLNQVIADERGFFTETEKRASGYEKQLEGPVKLFGGLDQSQIDQYLNPLSRSAAEGSARLEGAANRRGIAGSSTEFQTLADNERRYREDVLSQALQVGLAERERTTQLLTQQYGLLPGSLARQGQIAGIQSGNQFDETSYNNELPIYLRGISAQENAIQEAIQAREDAARQARKSGKYGFIGSAIGATAGAFTGNPMLVAAGAQIGGQVGGYAAGGTAQPLDLSTLLFLNSSMAKPRSNFIGGNSYRLPPPGGAGGVPYDLASA